MSSNGMKARQKTAYLEGFVSILVNTVLFILKYYVGVMFNSIAVIADAFHTLSDSLTSLVLIIGYRIAGKPPDREHPFGHGRAEFIGGLVIGVLLGVVGAEFTISSIEKIVSKLSLTYSDIIVGVLLLSTIAKLLLTIWAYKIGKKVDSQPVIADAWHHLSDTFATGLLSVAIFIGRSYWWIDGVLGLIISGLIMFTAMEVVYGASSELIGKAPASKELEKLVKVIKEEYPNVKRIHHVHFHRYGDHVEVTFHVDLPGNITLREAHEVATRLENAVRRKLGYEATVHVEPGEYSEGHVD
ncbi:MAG: cation diffusion facilitator family transporter [Desulfurococcaceae archaeon]